MKHLLNPKLLSKLTTTIVVCLWSLSAWSGSAIGIHDFGQDITENQSCEIAKLKATKQLIENEIGQVVQVNDLKACVNDNCQLNSFKWITFPGVVSQSKYTTQIEEREGKRYCVAKVTGIVVNIEKLYDKDHDFSVILNKNGLYYHNDYMELNIKALSKQHFKVFAVSDRAVQIYPNKHHDAGKTSNLYIPNPKYNLQMIKEENPNEILMVISSKNKFQMNTVYNLKDFTDKIMLMKTKDFRIRMYDYVVQ